MGNIMGPISTLKAGYWNQILSTACSTPKSALASVPEPTAIPLFLSLTNLPLDVLLLIADVLSPLPLWCLALTCRAFYFSLMPKVPPQLSADDKETFLLFLEKEAPNVYYCHACKKLHPWCPTGTITPSLLRRDRPCWEGGGLFVNNGLLSYGLARLVTNAYHHGPARGLPLSALESNKRVINTRFNVERRQICRARIIGGELFLRNEHAMRQIEGDARKLRSFVDGIAITACGHLWMCECGPPARKSWWPTQIPELRQQRRGGGPRDGEAPPFLPVKGAVRACEQCLVDVEVDVEWRDDKVGWIVRLVSWLYLGRCRDPADETWRVMTGSWARDTDVPRAAFAREEWIQDGDDEKAMTELEFEPPPSFVARWFKRSKDGVETLYATDDFDLAAFMKHLLKD